MKVVNCFCSLVLWCYQPVIIEKYLYPTQKDHYYALRKQEQPLAQCFKFLT